MAQRHRWINRPPDVTNFAIHPGIRHRSRLYTNPEPYLQPQSMYPEAQFKTVKNKFDAHDQLLMQLNDLRNLFTRQLPNMGATYITRLVFDLYAESVMMLHQGVVTAGICSRFFDEAQFVEIAFLAVDANSQACGYGRLIMNCLKTLLQTYEIYDILTCADNDAVTYFKKQGFNEKEIFVHPDRWLGCIKDYDFVTLVHCRVYPDVDYLRFPADLSKQFKALDRKIGVHSVPYIQSLDSPWQPTQYSPKMENVSIPKAVKLTNHKFTNPQFLEYLATYQETMENYRQKFRFILAELQKDENFSAMFQNPVTEDIAPNYFEEIKSPMDFRTIQYRLDRYSDYYKSPIQFANDIYAIAHNCKQYNNNDSSIQRLGNELWRKLRHIYGEQFPQLKNIPAVPPPAPPQQ